MDYSPKLKAAMEEIKATIKKYDIAGVVILHTPGFSEYLNAISPSYSCAKIANGDIVIRLKKDEVGSEKARQIANDTYNMFSHLTNNLGELFLPYDDARTSLKEKWKMNDGYRSNSSHESQNN